MKLVAQTDKMTSELGLLAEKGQATIQTVNITGNVQMFSSEKDQERGDRLLQSVHMVKEMLQSNMSLREQQLRLTEEHEKCLQDNCQLRIENEDLRDRLSLITKDPIYSIDYQAYLTHLDLEAIIGNTNSSEHLE